MFLLGGGILHFFFVKQIGVTVKSSFVIGGRIDYQNCKHKKTGLIGRFLSESLLS